MSIQSEQHSSGPENKTVQAIKSIEWSKLSKPPIVGIIGGGQLAQMLYQSAISLGIETHLFASVADEAAPKFFKDITRASSDTWAPSELYHFAQKCDVVTFDHELVSPAIVKELEKRGCLMLPSATTLELSTNKANQRLQLSEMGYSLPNFQVCSTLNETISFGDRFGWPIVVKPATGGYDGRGVFVIDDKVNLGVIFAGLTSRLPLVVESFLTLESEASVLAVRSTTGECHTYPAVKTLQLDGMCREVSSPSGLSEELEKEASAIAASIATQLDVVGILAVEFFVVDGKLLVNELAPRPHNTGHLTIEANLTSQFENHLRAILGLPLGATELKVGAAAMVNVISESNTQNITALIPAALGVTGANVHVYSKSSRKNRKIGHVTAVAASVNEALTTARDAANQLSATPAHGQENGR